MAVDFSKSFENRSDHELEEYLSNIMAYRREIVEAAVVELKKRGRFFSEEELNSIKDKIKEREETVGKNTITVRDASKKNIVTDESCPELYSVKIISVFSILFGVLFTSILMSINLSIVEKRKGIIWVLFFGIIVSIVQVLLNNYLLSNNFTSSISYSTLIINSMGAIVLSQVFWNKFIGKETKYRAKSSVVPLIIGIVISAASIFFIFIELGILHIGK
jgi:hypothetical protein